MKVERTKNSSAGVSEVEGRTQEAEGGKWGRWVAGGEAWESNSKS